jgi:hypothetical protein
MLFYVYSDHDVWWNPPLLASFLQPYFVEARSFYLVTGAGPYPGWTPNLIAGCGIVLSESSMQYIADKHNVDRARSALIRGDIYVVGVKQGAKYNNDHLVFAILAQLGKKLKYLASPTFLFNVWGSKMSQLLKAVEFQIHGVDGCAPALSTSPKVIKNLLRGGTSRIEGEPACALDVFQRGTVAVHHIKARDVVFLQESVSADADISSCATPSKCTMPGVFGKSLGFFMRLGAGPWARLEASAKVSQHAAAMKSCADMGVVMKDHDIYGHDLGGFPRIPDVQHCCALCAMWPTCSHWTFSVSDSDSRDNERCYLKALLQQGAFTPRNGFTSGVIQARLQPADFNSLWG